MHNIHNIDGIGNFGLYSVANLAAFGFHKLAMLIQTTIILTVTWTSVYTIILNVLTILSLLFGVIIALPKVWQVLKMIPETKLVDLFKIFWSWCKGNCVSVIKKLKFKK